MDNDFPAAHSMDTEWYAIDQNGYVAHFFSGAGGAVPNTAYCPGSLEQLADMDLDDETRAQFEAESLADIPADQLPDGKRLFHYETSAFDECLADRYERTSVPKKPIHVDELPPQVRSAIGAMHFDRLDFATTEVFQPVELTECTTWDPAYLTGDGKTVKPVPGREKEYAEYLEESRDVFDDENLTVEEPPKKKRKPRGKKKG